MMGYDLTMSGILLKQHFKFIALLLMAVMALTNFSGRQIPAFANVAPVSQMVLAKPVSTCQQAKLAQSQNARSCQSLFGGYAMLADIIHFFHTLTGKLYFLFVAAMVAVGFHRRLFKPPKQICC